MKNNKKENEESLNDDNEEYTKEDVLKVVGEIFNNYKQSYKKASKKDKKTILAIFLPLTITFIIGTVGVLFANIGKYLVLHTIQVVGFVLMGVGLGGFALIIVIILIWSKIKEKR